MRAKFLLTCIYNARGFTLSQGGKDVRSLREIVSLERIEMNGLMTLNGFTLERLERSGCDR